MASSIVFANLAAPNLLVQSALLRCQFADTMVFFRGRLAAAGFGVNPGEYGCGSAN